MKICEKKQHTLRNPLQILQGIIKLWRKQNKISSEEKKYALEVIERIHGCTEIKDMLEEKTDES
ncbi:MAG: hypothetical protein CMB80_03065 [Flammeovirgaceae bacterium]|nr:hypothetical protein [Flammeovirgaceae bacterium]|tara:strand:- start:837 stop:1028 length:192 start_codon:yes stop_codon:yes gene_type:complete